MARVASRVVDRAVQILTAECGLATQIPILSGETDTYLPEIGARRVIAENVPVELAEKSTAVKYPEVRVYCDKLVNSLREKFRTFSGTAHLIIEIRVSHDRLQGIEDQLQLYVDAVAQVLYSSRGDWGNGMCFAGGYEAVFAAVKHGGKNFLQIAKVSLDVDISIH